MQERRGQRCTRTRPENRESADAGSIPVASTSLQIAFGLEHLALALLHLEEGLSQVCRIELGISRRRPNVCVAEE